MTPYLKFGELLGQYLTVKTLPDVKFNSEISLRANANTLVAMSNVPDDADFTDVTVIGTLMKELHDANADMAANGPIFTEFQEVADAFAKKLNTALVDLRKVKTTVTTLTADVASFQCNLLASDAEVSVTNEIKSEDVGFGTIDWTPIELVGSERAIVIAMHGLINYDDSRTIDNETIGLLLAKLPMYNEGDGFVFDTVELSDDQVKTVVTAIEEVRKESWIGDIQWVVRKIVKPSENDFRYNNNTLKKLAESPDDLAWQIRELGRMAVVLSVLKNNDFGFSESTKKIVDENCEIWKQYLMMYAYIAIHYRRDIWNNAILVGPSTYNPDNWDDFVAQGGTLQKLAMYYTFFHKDANIVVPLSGVSVKYVLENVAKAEEEVNAKAAELSESVNSKKAAARRQAFISVMTKFMSEQSDEWFSTAYKTRMHSEHAASVYDSYPVETPIEDMIYRLYFNTAQTTWLTRNLFHRLGQAYMKHLASTEEFTVETGDVIDMATFASVIAEFVVSNMISVD